MKTKLQISIFLVLITCFCFGQAPTIKWQKSYGGSEDDQARAVQQTTDGGYILAGFSKSSNGQVTGHHGGSEYDYWVVKIKGGGKLQWGKSLGGSDFDIANAVSQTSDGGYIVAGASASNDGDVTGGHGDDDYWVVKLDANGNLVWQKALGGIGDDVAQSVKQTSDGGYIVAGSSSSFNGDVTGNHGGLDYWVVKLDPDGNLVWQKSLGGANTDVATSTQQTTDGGYIVAGFSNSTDGNVTNNHGSDDYWIVKLDSSGNLLWQKTYGGSNLDEAYSIKQSKDGGYFVAGQSLSNNGDVSGNHGTTGDYWVIRLNKSGSLVWQKALGGTDYDIAFNLSLTKDGGCVVAGTARSTDGDITNPHGNYDYWLVQLSGTGVLNWQLSLGGSDYDEAYSIQQTTGGSFVVAGFTFSNDGDVTTNHGNNDFWVVKLQTAGSGGDKPASNETVSENRLTSSGEFNYSNTLSIYPTLSEGTITIDFKINNTNAQTALLELMSSTGVIISATNVVISNGILHQEIQLDSKLPEGIYFVRIVLGNSNYNQHFFLRQ